MSVTVRTDNYISGNFEGRLLEDGRADLIVRSRTPADAARAPIGLRLRAYEKSDSIAVAQQIATTYSMRRAKRYRCTTWMRTLAASRSRLIYTHNDRKNYAYNLGHTLHSAHDHSRKSRSRGMTT